MAKVAILRKIVDDNEKIIAVARMSAWKLFDEFVFAIIAASMIIAAHFVFDNPIVTLVVAGVLALAWLIKAFADLVYVYLTVLALTTRKVYFRKGFLRIRAISMPLRNIDNIQVNFSAIGRIFNCGTITIETRSEPLTLKYVVAPHRFKSLVDRACQGYVPTRR